MDAFFCMPDEASQNWLELCGSQGSILATGTIGQAADGTMTAILKSGAQAYEARQTRTDGRVLPIEPRPFNTYRAEIEEFGCSILEGREPSISAALGLRNQRILAACYESARLDRTVSIPAR